MVRLYIYPSSQHVNDWHFPQLAHFLSIQTIPLIATVNIDSIQFFHLHSILRATSSKSTSLLQIKSQQRAAKATTRRVDRETALTRIQIASNGVVGKEHTCYISDTDDDNEFPSVEELLQQPSHITNSLKERANHHFTP